MNPQTLRAAALGVFACGWIAACDVSDFATSTDSITPFRIIVIA